MLHFFKKSNRKTTLILFAFATVFLAVPESAHAAWFDAASNVVGSIFSLSLEVFILPLAAAIMYIAGSIMDSAINFGLHTAYIFALSPAINLGWVIIRDIANIFFIFILIYISLGTIVQGTKFGTKQLLTQVIIAALLINFSLFITKAVIDVSNVFGNWLYGGIQKTLIANTAGCNIDNPTGCTSPTSMSGLIATRLGVIGFWDATKNTNGASGGSPITSSDPTQGFIGRFLRLSVVLITTYIFLYCAILFIARSITLLFLLVFSPVGFMGGVLPQLKKYSGQWRDELLSAAIFPVAFLLMLYIAMQFINSLQLLDLGTLKDDITLFGINMKLSQYFQYFLIIFLLQACLKIAKENSGEMGKALGGLADGLGKLAVNAAIGIGTGGVAMAGRTIAAGAFAEKGKGRAAMWDTFRSNSPLLTSLTTGPRIWTKEGIKKVRDDVLKKGTYDVRNLPTGRGSLAEMAKEATGYDVAKTSVLGFKTEAQTRKDIKESRKEFDEEIKIDKEQTIIMKEMRDLLAAQDNLKKAEAIGNPTTIATAQADITRIKGVMGTTGADSRIKTSLNNLSNKQLEKLNPKLNTNEHVVGLMTSAEVKHLKDNSELSDIDKAKVWSARIKPLTQAIALPIGTPNRANDIENALINLSDTEVAELKPEILKDPLIIPLLTPGQLSKIAQNLSRADRAEIRRLIGRPPAAGGGTQAQNWLDNDRGPGAQF
ncbi:MAG: hypothetical protein AAB922_01775 [Patescibacteria group bacterium]